MLFVTRRRSLRTIAACSVAAVALLAACGTAPQAPQPVASEAPGSPSAPATSGGTATQAPPAKPLTMTANVDDGATKVAVDTLIGVEADGGSLSKVKVRYAGVDNNGKAIKGSVSGELSADATSWTADERLEPSSTYTISMTGKNAADGATSTRKATFTTQSLTLAQQTYASIYPGKGSTVGIGMPVILRFDVAVKDKATFEKNLTVTSSPKQVGVWHWYSSKEVHYRPKTYWKPGTEVTVKANLNGLKAGNGVYGQKSVSTSFTVGRSLITKVDLKRDVAKVYRNGNLVRTIAVTGGKPGWQTRSGIKLIMAKEYNKVMTNEAIGAKEEYRLTAKYAMRVTNSGEFLHSAPWSLGNLGRRNASHGCVGMSIADSGWLYNTTLIGDPVVTTGTSRGLEQGNGWADWDISWKQYKAGSAL